MSVRRTSEALSPRAALIFAGAVAVLCLALFFGIATRVSLGEDNATVALAGISRVLTGGMNHFLDVTFIVFVLCLAYCAALWALHKRFRHDFAAVIVGTILAGMSM